MAKTAGSFEMGDHTNDPPSWRERCRPVHTVTLDGFYMDKTEVTVGQFKAFLADTDYDWGGGGPWSYVDQYSPSDGHPMIYVNWNGAKAYAEWAGKRLPTEAEWEYAARGGLRAKRYVWGNSTPNGSQCNYADKNADSILRQINKDHTFSDMKVDDGYAYTAPVGSFAPNGYGLYDMAGNVGEWCADWYDSNFYVNSPVNNPQGPESGEYRVLRGGSWASASGNLRVANRFNDNPANASDGGYGFRCVSGL